MQVKDFAEYSNGITLHMWKHALDVGCSIPECCWSDCSHLLLKIKNKFSHLSGIISDLCQRNWRYILVLEAVMLCESWCWISDCRKEKCQVLFCLQLEWNILHSILKALNACGYGSTPPRPPARMRNGHQTCLHPSCSCGPSANCDFAYWQWQEHKLAARRISSVQHQSI